ncbi:MAG: LysR family transcriptional regulator [Pseudomonadales bacterium]|nr:LysR family transcriptional regulator [Pseudomonadales bacterium]
MFSHIPQLNSIKVFDSAARLKTFKASAIELNVTLAAVFQQIRALLKELETLLLGAKSG